jgi:ribosome-binding factor A
MDTVRQQKVARLIQKEIGSILQKEAKGLYPGGLITVTMVRVSPDLALSRIFLSIFPSDKKNEVFEKLNAEKWRIRHELASLVKKQLRIVPEIAFFHDDSGDYLENIEKLLKK